VRPRPCAKSNISAGPRDRDTFISLWFARCCCGDLSFANPMRCDGSCRAGHHAGHRDNYLHQSLLYRLCRAKYVAVDGAAAPSSDQLAALTAHFFIRGRLRDSSVWMTEQPQHRRVFEQVIAPEPRGSARAGRSTRSQPGRPRVGPLVSSHHESRSDAPMPDATPGTVFSGRTGSGSSLLGLGPRLRE